MGGRRRNTAVIHGGTTWYDDLIMSENSMYHSAVFFCANVFIHTSYIVLAQTEWSQGLHHITLFMSEMLHFGDEGVLRSMLRAQKFISRV